MPSLFCFADSWGTPAELPKDTLTFGHNVSNHLNLQFKNYSQAGYSMGIILHTLVNKINEISVNDVVLVVCPPDVRWYDQKSNGEFVTLALNDPEYKHFLANKQISWFYYHHALFIYSIQKMLDDVGCKYLMALNYGDFDAIKQYSFKIDYNKFVSDTDLASMLLGISADNGNAWQNTLKEDGPSEHIFNGEYFEGCRWHPNSKGHKKIASYFIEKFETLHFA